MRFNARAAFQADPITIKVYSLCCGENRARTCTPVSRYRFSRPGRYQLRFTSPSNLEESVGLEPTKVLPFTSFQNQAFIQPVTLHIFVIPEGIEPPPDRSQRPILSVKRWNQLKTKNPQTLRFVGFILIFYINYEYNRTSLKLLERLDELDDVVIIVFILFIY